MGNHARSIHGNVVSNKWFPLFQKDADNEPFVAPVESISPNDATLSHKRWPTPTTSSMNTWLIGLATEFGFEHRQLRMHGLRGSKAYLEYLRTNDFNQVCERMGWAKNSSMPLRYARIKQLQASQVTPSAGQYKELVGFNWTPLAEF